MQYRVEKYIQVDPYMTCWADKCKKDLEQYAEYYFTFLWKAF